MTYRRLPSFPRPLGLGALAALGLAVAPSPARAAITLAADAAAAFEAKVFQNGLSAPTDLAVLPDGRVIIIQKGGDIATVPAAGGDPIEDHIDVNTTSEQGLLGIVPDPSFATNQYIYVYADKPDTVADARNNRHQILRYKFGADSKLGTKTVVLDMGLEGPANHDGGGIDIYGGNLYMGVGDTGANASPPSNRYGSCLNKGNGKVLRISLADATLGQPAADNPLVNVPMVTGCDTVTGAFKMMAPDKRIFAWGFRNPYRVWVDKTNGKVWVGDVGEVTREEIDIVQLGKHYGYPFREGNKDWMQAFAPAEQCMGMTPASECIAPVFEYDRVGTKGCVIGGRILDGCDWPAAWKSRYIFGDYNLNKIWTVDVNATRDGVVANSQKDFATSSSLTAMRMGTDNALYILEEGGTVTRVTAKGGTATANSCPSVNGDPTPPGGGGSGSNGGAGGAAVGGNSPTAGQTSTAGQATAAGSGGAPSAAGSASTVAGTTSSTAGKSNMSDAGSANGGSSGDSGDSGGCGCQVVGGPVASSFGLGALIAAFAVGLRRRRGRKSR